MVTLIVLIISAMTFVVSGGQAKVETVTGGASIFSPNSVSQELNLTISHLSYTTEPPAFLVNSTNYAQNATYTAGSQWVVNATYQIFQHNTSVTGTTASVLGYNIANYLKSPTEYFADAKLGFNGTGGSNDSFVMILSENAQTGVPSSTFASTNTAAQNRSQATAAWIVFNGTANKTLGTTYNATMYYFYTSAGTGATTKLNTTKVFHGVSMKALDMYEVQWNLQAKSQQVSIVYTSNGTVVQNSPLMTMSNATKVPYLNFTALSHVTFLFTPTTKSGGLLFDWMYVVDKNTYSYPSVSLATAGAIAGSGSYINAKDPFDPSSLSGKSQYQSANVSNSISNAQVSNDAFTTTYNQSNPMMQNATGLNNSQQVSTYNTQFNASQAVVSTAFAPNTNATANITEVANTWNTQYVKTVLTAFLKDYASVKATKLLGSYVSPNQITLIDFRIGSMFLNTNYTPSAATALRNGLDNEYASVLANNNLGIVNPTSSAIVAGAHAGDFYSPTLGAVVPEIRNGMIVNPMTGQEYTLASAGFSAGAYISGGSVIVPQFQIVGWTSAGSPIFAETYGFSFGSLFGGLSSAGKAVNSLFTSAASTVQNGIGAVANTVDNNVIKPITPTVNVVTSAVNKQVADIQHSILGTTGIVSGDIQHAINSGGLFAKTTLNSVNQGLASVQSDVASGIMAGYHGAKTGLMSIGASVKGTVTNASNGLSGIKNALVNTAGHASSTATGALSTVYTKMSNFVSGSASNVYASLRGAANTSIAALDSVGNNLVQATNSAGNLIKGAWTSTTNTLGGIANAMGSFGSSVKGFFSAFAGLPSEVVHVLTYVAIGLVIVGIAIVAFFIWRKRSSKGHPGEMSI